MLCGKKDPRKGPIAKIVIQNTKWIIFEAQKGAGKSVSADGSCRLGKMLGFEQRGLNSKRDPSFSSPPPVPSAPL
jgi:hypothetical protein